MYSLKFIFRGRRGGGATRLPTPIAGSATGSTLQAMNLSWAQMEPENKQHQQKISCARIARRKRRRRVFRRGVGGWGGGEVVGSYNNLPMKRDCALTECHSQVSHSLPPQESCSTGRGGAGWGGVWAQAHALCYIIDLSQSSCVSDKEIKIVAKAN